MKNNSFTILCWLLVSAFGACQSSGDITIDDKALLNNLKELSSDAYEGRAFATKGNQKGQAFVAQKFKEAGLSYYQGNSFIQSFDHTFTGRWRQRLYPVKNAKKDLSNVPDTTLVGGNVVGMIKGKTDKTIVITAHHDHLGKRGDKIYNGADDDASGTAALIAMANYFNAKSPKHNLVFAAVDAEEIGSHGAEYFAKNFENIKQKVVLNINMDMIAHNNNNELYASGLHHYPQLKPQLENLKSSVSLLFGHDPSNPKQDDWTHSSDHRIFHKRGIPFVYFGVEDHKDYHKPTDTFENINPQFYIEAVKLIIEVIENFDQGL